MAQVAATSPTIAFPEAIPRIDAAYAEGRLKPGGWGNGTQAVCMMSAAIPGADSVEDCITAGWPEWLVEVNVTLFDTDVVSDDEELARWGFARDVAQAVATRRDMDRARHLFALARLSTGDLSIITALAELDGEWPHHEAAVLAVAALVRRRADGIATPDDEQAAQDALDASNRHTPADTNHPAKITLDAAISAAVAAKEGSPVIFVAGHAVEVFAWSVANGREVARDEAWKATRRDLVAALNAA